MVKGRSGRYDFAWLVQSSLGGIGWGRHLKALPVRASVCTSLCLLEGAAGPPGQTGFLSELINISSTLWLWTKEALAPTSFQCGSTLCLIHMRVIYLSKCDCTAVLPNRHEHHPHSQPSPFSIRRQQKSPQYSCRPLYHFRKRKCRGQTTLPSCNLAPAIVQAAVIFWNVRGWHSLSFLGTGFYVIFFNDLKYFSNM